ncbi:MAG: hypothetical protein KAR84_06260 [Elusimicrobiales bacterium]|nr:hypothetical protein [Elusimicrobiales bacterium]
MKILRRINNSYFNKWFLCLLIASICSAVLSAMIFSDKSYDVFFEGPEGDNINFASASETNPHSAIVQGADFDKVWRARIGDVNYEIGFSYCFVKSAGGVKKLLVDSLVLSFVEDGLRVNIAPLAYFFGNRYPYEGADKTPNAEMPPSQSNLSFGIPSNVETRTTKDSFNIKMSFNRSLAHIYTLRKSSLGEWIPLGFKPDIIPYDGMTADVVIKFSRLNPYKVSIDTTRRLSENIDNHNGFNLLTQIIYSSEPVKVSYLATGQTLAPAIGSKEIASLQLLKSGWQMLKTREFDKGRKILGGGKKFDHRWIVETRNR